MFGLARDIALAFSSSISTVYLLFTSTWPSALGAHAITMLFSAMVLTTWFKLKNVDQKGLWTITMITIAFVPGFCLVALPAALVYGGTPPKKAALDLTMLVPTPNLPFKPLQFDSQLAFSRGGLFEVLERSSDPDKRLTAVMATTRMPVQLAIPLLKIAMRDAVDDVRLLAYSIKDKHESEINDRIKSLSEGLELGDSTDLDATEESIERASAFRSLAFAYWELVYLELAEGQIRNFCLTQTIEHAQRALHTLRDGPVAVLLARAYLHTGDTQAASEALLTAETFGMTAAVLAPHKAEIAFAEARYGDIPDLLAPVNSNSFERLDDVRSFWLSAA